MGDSLFSTFAARKKNEEVLDRHISEWTRNFTAEEIMEKLQSACLEGTVVKDAKEMYEDPHLQEYLWAKMHHPEIGPHHVQVPPFKLSKSPCQLRRPAPLLGEHNECVYRDMAGLSLEEYEEFQKEGVFH
jgi:crotonobetainyl-CoA:carnitine CoA-transferase CaiB-like acyl-CoA transferase